MALRLGALEDALLDAGASPDKAKQAAEELVSSQVARLDARLAVVRAMVVATLALTLVNFWLLFIILSRLPR